MDEQEDCAQREGQNVAEEIKDYLKSSREFQSIRQLQQDLESLREVLQSTRDQLSQLRDSQEKYLERLSHLDQGHLGPRPDSANDVSSALLQDMTNDMQRLREELETMKEKKQMAPPELSAPYSEEVSVDENLVAVDVRGRTNLENEKMIEMELERIRMEKSLVDGSTLVEESLTGISKAIQGDTSMIMEICNYLRVPLTEPKNLLLNGKPGNALPPTIVGETREMLCFYSRSGYTQVLISFAIYSVHLRVIMSLIVRREGGCHLVLALAPSETPIDENLHTFLWENKTEHRFRPDKKRGYYENHAGHLVAKCGSIVARAYLNPGTKAMLTVEVTSTAGAVRITHNHMGVVEVEKEMGRSLTVPNVAGNDEDYECAFHLCNLLNVYLEDVSVYMVSGEQSLSFPALAKPKSKQVFFESHSRKVEGIFSYRIRSTDIRLAVAFCIQPGENNFGVGFVPLDSPTDDVLLDTITDNVEWRTRPDKKFAYARDGDVTVEIRNITFRASLTDDPKAILRMVIYTV